MIFPVTQTMIDYWEKKYKDIPEEVWPNGLKEMMIEQTLIFKVGKVILQ